MPKEFSTLAHTKKLSEQAHCVKNGLEQQQAVPDLGMLLLRLPLMQRQNAAAAEMSVQSCSKGYN